MHETPSTSFSAGAGAGGSRELTAAEQSNFDRRKRRGRIVGISVLVAIPLCLGILVWGGSGEKELVRRKGYPNGNLHVESTYKSGMLNGPYSEYYDNKQLKKQGQFENGQKVGSWEYFAKSGHILRAGNFSNNNRFGPWTSYHPNGEVRFLAEYGRGGVRVDVGRSFYEDGTKSAEQPYQNGLVHGTERGWFRNGQLSSTTTYVLGQLHGRSRTWYENGQLESDGEYAYGDRVGVWRSLDESGKVTSLFDHDAGGDVIIAGEATTGEHAELD